MSWLFGSALRPTLVERADALPGRDAPAYTVPPTHTVLGTPLAGPGPAGTRGLYLAAGGVWGGA